ncbi:hypothetical protein [Novosphingobium album (ex Liu et al. 2023)]|uniref:Uncharacterized protein n=1 Tax=Novosphingobium album (ex Liu et al. 2023) TaxID=3031130 RepID=A0ABT5WQ36_9SPHN|nr:hypothetical protein [Novosphingobium album (ex Liu et al. 2023)]MDE8651387.1 hypothetical protein [Novosphingobium album (ex Liu et al. 2023)]
MENLAKALIGTVAAGAMAVSAATPAFAREGDGIGTGEIVAGALIIGGIAAVAASAGDSDGRYAYGRDDRYRDRPYGNGRYGMTSRQAVAQCVRAAESTASRRSYGRAKVTDIRKIKRTSRGYDVSGRIAVNGNARGWRAGDSRYGRGWNGDYRGWNANLRGYDSGTFKCDVEYGRIADLDFSGIRGL